MSEPCAYEFDPDEYSETTITATWSCPRDRVGGSDECPFHMSAADRATHEIPDATVRDRLVDTLKHGQGEERRFVGASLPELDLAYLDVEGEDQHPIDLRHATVDGDLAMDFTRFEELLDLRHAEVGGLTAENATFDDGILCSGATFDGPVDLFEAVFRGENAEFTDVRFGDEVVFDEADFDDDVSFDRTTFTADVTFLGTQFYGTANSIGDNTTFVDATFEGSASFDHATFEYTEFDGCEFRGSAVFEHADANGTITFADCSFDEGAAFDEFECSEDAHFERATFSAAASFRGLIVEGGTMVLADDIAFEGATFEGPVAFDESKFGSGNFREAVFEADATFERVSFEADLTFEDARFHATADFSEVQFHGDSDFTGVTFRETAVFQGSEFHGGTNYLEDDAIFTRAVFLDDADFRNVKFEAANFMETQFKGSADFSETVTAHIELQVTSFGEETYFDFIGARIENGRILQPRDGWVRFDFTEATIGSVRLGAMTMSDERDLLSYFRFCDTTFDGFDFASHTSYLDRNDWTLHAFDASHEDHDVGAEMTPAVVEKTYLKAKADASAQSNIKAAGEFRVKRQQYARKKFYGIARDRTEALGTRLQNGLRATENLFLGLTCGYGLRLYRIATVFVLLPLLAGFLFAFGGETFATSTEQVNSLSELGTADGLERLALNVYFSYITFLTIGYGNIGPQGMSARFTAAGLVYLNVILAGLFLYALIKRSEI